MFNDETEVLSFISYFIWN